VIEKATRYASELFSLAQVISVFRASVAYLLQHIRIFTTAIQQLKSRDLASVEVQAFQKLSALVGQLANLRDARM
jgi:hypothetical protein